MCISLPFMYTMFMRYFLGAVACAVGAVAQSQVAYGRWTPTAYGRILRSRTCRRCSDEISRRQTRLLATPSLFVHSAFR